MFIVMVLVAACWFGASIVLHVIVRCVFRRFFNVSRCCSRGTLDGALNLCTSIYLVPQQSFVVSLTRRKRID
jgi:hypothetical protein